MSAIIPYLTARRGGRVDRERRACDGVLLSRINAIFISATCCRTRCCDAQCAGAAVISKNAIITTRRGGRVNREVVPCWHNMYFRINAIAHGTRCSTRCRDTQCAGADSFRINAIVAPVVVAALIVRDVPAEELYA